MLPVVAGNVLTAGLRNDFADTYKITYKGVAARLGEVMDMNIPSDKLTELYAYFETAPYPKRWPKGEDISSKSFKSVGFNVTNLDWGRRVPWHTNDRADDQTKSLFDMARDAGAHWATLPERIFFQILQSTTDSDLLAAIPLSPDGVGLFSAVDGDGNDRFGVSGGNLFAANGLTASQIRTDAFDIFERFRQMQDTEDQPLWDDSVVDQGFVIFYGVQNWENFSSAFQQGRTVQIVQNVAGTENVAATVPTNIILDSGIRVTLVPTQRIADNDWYVFLRGAKKKAIFRQIRQALFESFATWDTSDHTRTTGEEYIQWKSREGYSIALPYAAIKANN